MLSSKYIKVVFKYKIFRPLKKTFKKIIARDSDIHSICMGLSIGMFIGMFAIPGQMLVALFVAGSLRYNTVAAVSAVWITNPFTYVPIYYLAYRIGLLFFDENEIFNFSHLNFDSIFEVGKQILYPLFLGSFALGLIVAPITYFTFRPILKKILPILQNKQHYLDTSEKK